jgi:glycosyltransferase involved in cell wall biosynthesis/GT2 family glycosyltransferase
MRALRVSHSGVVDAWRARERGLTALGHEVHLITAASWNEFGAEVSLRPKSGEHVTGARTLGRHPALFLYDPRPLWRALGEDWDVIDIHEEPFALCTAEIVLLRWLRRQPAPYTLYSAQNIDKRYPPPFRWLERWSLRHASGVSVCNREAGAIVERKGYPGRSSLIPLGIDLAHFVPPPTARPACDEVITVGYAGRLERHKGVNVLLDAVARDERLHLRAAGAGPDHDALVARAADLGISDRVVFSGAVGQEGLPDFYRSLDVLAVPSLTTDSWVEQFGRVAVEAMACGVPVVASNSGALPDVVSDAGMLVPPGDSAALATALIEVGSDEALRAHLRRQGLERAAATSWDRVAAAYASMYDLATHASSRADAHRGLDVVVVAYGAPELLAEALAPVRDLDVTVIDNSSSLRVREVAQRFGATYVDPGRNGGFAAGVNEGLRRRRHPGGDVLLLNPDAVVTTEAVGELRRALAADPGLASVGPSQTDAAGAPSRVTWPFPTPGRTWLEAVGLSRLNRRPDFVIGSVLLLRGEAIAHVGGFDEGYFLYSEETDWAHRASLLGWRHAEVPTAVAVHVGAATSTDPRVREVRFHASLERYLRKHHGTVGWWLARSGQVVGSAARAAVLPGTRRAAARTRLSLYLRGPVKVAGPEGLTREEVVAHA